MRRVRLWGGVIGLGLLLSMPVVEASSGAFTLTASLPIRVVGNVTVSTSQGDFLVEGGNGTVDLVLAGPADLVVVTDRVWGAFQSYEDNARVVWHGAIERETITLATGDTLRLTEPGPDFLFLAYGSGLAVQQAAPQDPLRVEAAALRTVQYATKQNGVEMNVPQDGDLFSHDLPSPAFAAVPTAGRLVLDDQDAVYVDDARLVIAGTTDRELIAQRRVEEASGGVFDPTTSTWTGPGTHQELVQQYVLADLHGGQGEVNFSGLPAQLVGEAVDVQATGFAAVPGASGSIVLQELGDDERHRLAGEDLTLTGRFNMRLRAPAGPVQVEGDGDLTHVAYSGVAAQYDWARTATIVGLGAVGLAVLAWLGRTFGPGFLAGYARVAGEEILEHPVRRDAYDLILDNPGITTKDLESAFDITAATLAFHLRVLERNQYITTARRGRSMQYFDRRSGAFAGDRKDAAALLANATSGRIARLVKAHEGIFQRDLAQAAGLAPSTVNWHARRLIDVGLLREDRSGKFTRYFSGPAWAGLPTGSGDVAPRQAD